MFATKTRPTIAALATVAALSAMGTGVASAAGPTGALEDTPITLQPPVEPGPVARPNDGRYSRSAEAKHKAFICDFAKFVLDDAEKKADEAADKGDKRTAGQWGKLADQMWAEGEKAGCAWAQ
jgi:hypothetical protein